MEIVSCHGQELFEFFYQDFDESTVRTLWEAIFDEITDADDEVSACKAKHTEDDDNEESRLSPPKVLVQDDNGTIDQGNESMTASNLIHYTGGRTSPFPDTKSYSYEVGTRSSRATGSTKQSSIAPRKLELELSGLTQTIICSFETFMDHYLPLAQWNLLKLLGKNVFPELVRNASDVKRSIVGVSGGAASGKSFLAHVLVRIVNQLWLLGCQQVTGKAPKTELCVAVGMDGYHHTNSYLKSKPVPAEYTHHLPPEEQQHSLKDIKGCEPTINAEKLAKDLDTLLNPSTTTTLPEYDRKLHDPVENHVAIVPDRLLVIFEGLYMLHGSQLDSPASEEVKRWKPVTSKLDCAIYLDVSEEESRYRLVRRKMSSGFTEAEATKRYNRNDLKILRRVSEGQNAADLIIRFNQVQNSTRMLPFSYVICQPNAERWRTTSSA